MAVELTVFIMMILFEEKLFIATCNNKFLKKITIQLFYFLLQIL